MDIAKAGLVVGVTGFIAEILQFGFGYYCDKGYRKGILITGLILGSSILFITFTGSLGESFFVLLLLMLGSSAFHPAAVGYAGMLSKHHKGKTILLFASGGAIGLGISQLVFTYTLGQMGGHATILYVPAVLVMLLVLTHRFPKSSIEEGPRTKEALLSPLLEKKRSFLFLYLIQVTNCAVVMSFVFLLPDILLSKTKESWVYLGGGHMCFILGSALALPILGYLCDKIGQRKVLITMTLSSFILLYIFLQMENPSLLAAMGILTLLGGCLHSINPIVVSWGHKLAPGSPSIVSGLLMGFAWCLTNFGPTCSGFLCRYFTENAVTKSISCMSLLLIASLVFVLCMPKEEAVKVPA